MVGGWAYHVVVCGGFAHGVSTLSCLQAVHEVCVDRGSPLVLSRTVRGPGRGRFGRTCDSSVSFSRSLGKATSRPCSGAFLSGIPGCSGVTYVGAPLGGFQYGGLFNFVAPGGRRAQRGVGANWLVLGSRGYIRRTLLLLLRTSQFWATKIRMFQLFAGYCNHGFPYSPPQSYPSRGSPP